MSTLTSAEYYASLHPALLALCKGATSGPFAGVPYAWLVDPSYINYGIASRTAAVTLLNAAKATGLPIDTQIMIWNWDPQQTMELRQINGYQWVPNYGGTNINIAPGLSMPGVLSNYPSSMPAGWIKVSTESADYPPYVFPTTSMPVKIPVGPQEGPGSPYYGVMVPNPPASWPGPVANEQYVLVKIATSDVLGEPVTEQFYILIVVQDASAS